MLGVLKPKKIYADDIGLLIDDAWVTEGMTFEKTIPPLTYGKDKKPLERADCLTVKWSSDSGFGEYTFAFVFHEDETFDLVGLSETMDSDDDKEFARCIMNYLVDKMYIAE